MSRRRTAGPGLDERLSALAAAVAHADGVLLPEQLAPARAVLERAGERGALAPGVTVAALLGATGSGKSSLFNALVGEPLAAVHVRRPTTTRPLAVSWDAPGAAALLDWLQVPDRHERPPEPGRSGLVLLDLPDVDSTTTANRETATRLAERVDVLVWVLDPQKYADGVVHEDYLRPLHEHAAVSLVVLNQVDRLPASEVPQVLAHLREILSRDGLEGVELLTTSARTGAGVDAVGDRLATLAAAGRAAGERLAADVRAVAGRLPAAPLPRDGSEVGAEPAARLVTACAAAAGAQEVTRAVDRSYRARAARHVGWPPLRWLSRLRPDPLRRLHLEAPSTARTSLPAATPAQEAGVRTGVRDLAWEASGQLPEPWRASVTSGAEDRVPALVDALDAAVAGTDLGAQRRPGWWRLWSALGLLLFAAAVVGGLWLGGLALMGYLQLPQPDTPMAGPLPWPTALLLGGLAAGLALAVVGRLLARVGARRAARRAGRALERRIARTVHEEMVDPLTADLVRYRDFATALATARA